MRLLRTAIALAALTGASAAMAQTDVKMTAFGGASNVSTWIAIDKGFFEKEGLKVTLEQTPGSKEQMQDIMSGKYQFASTAFDNVVAYTEGQGTDKFDNYDVFAFAGVHSGMNSVVARPEIKSYADVKGKVAAVDSPTSGYATVLYQIIKNKTGMEQNKDYKLESVGGTGGRVKALRDGTSAIAMISTPEDMLLKADGFNILGDAAVEIGAYQGSAYVVRRSYAKDHEKEVYAFIRAIKAATDYTFSDRAGTIEVMMKRIKGLSTENANIIYDRLVGPGGLNRGASLNVEGIKTVLKLRSVYGQQKETEPAKYIDTSWVDRALKK